MSVELVRIEGNDGTPYWINLAHVVSVGSGESCDLDRPESEWVKGPEDGQSHPPVEPVLYVQMTGEVSPNPMQLFRGEMEQLLDALDARAYPPRWLHSESRA